MPYVHIAFEWFNLYEMKNQQSSKVFLTKTLKQL